MQTISTKQIEITDFYIKRAQDKLVEYLLSLDTNRFLFEVYKVAGLEPVTEIGYGGWERSDAINFRGHFFGHYLSALSLAYQAEKDGEKKQRLLELVQEGVIGLDLAQRHFANENPESAGYISAFKETALDEVEGKKIDSKDKENVLVPWYNLHKILAGLLEVYDCFGDEQPELSQLALTIAANFGDYIYRRMRKLQDKKQMLTIEYGGMNDALYHLFECTSQKEHLIAATYFDEEDLFDSLVRGEDVLSGKHANTMIPKLIGALKRYTVLKNKSDFLTEEEKKNLERYLQAAKNFWDITVKGHTYVTGGNSQSEHFHEANELYTDSEIRNGDCTCETCNTHNMLKLSRNLFFVTKEAKYLDYYERTYINAILASQNPQTGMMMYFQPMGAGYNKVYNRPYDEFWCCTGTGIESFAKLADTYYFIDNKILFVNNYFSNRLELPEYNLLLINETKRQKFSSKFLVRTINKKETLLPFKIALRVPFWAEKVTLKINNQLFEGTNSNGYLILPECLNERDRVEVIFESTPKWSATSDNPNYVALQYGPYVFAGGLGKTELTKDNPNGILVRVGTKERGLTDSLTVTDPDWLLKPMEYLAFEEVEGKLMGLRALGTEEQILFTPYYEMHDERYGIYFKLIEKNSEEAAHSLREKEKIMKKQALIYQELTNFDENNSEYARNLRYQDSFVDNFFGRRFRQARDGGWFSYDFRFETETDEFYLELIFHHSDAGKCCEIIVNNDKKMEYTIPSATEEEFFIQRYLLSKDEIKEAGITITFSSVNGLTPRIFGISFVKR